MGADHRSDCAALEHPAHEDQVGLMQPRDRPHLAQPRAAKKHPRCLEYVVVHEMTHLLERNHGERFTKLMDKFMPDWRSRRDELNGAPLAEEKWAIGGSA